MSERHVGIGFEGTWNTPVAPTVFLEAQSEGVQLEPTYQQIKTIRSNVTRDLALGFDVVRGPVSCLANYQDLAHLFYMILGSVAAPVGTDPYTHTLPAATGMADLVGLTVEVRRDDPLGGDEQTWRYAGCLMNQLALAVALEQAMTCELGFVGGSAAQGTAATPTYPAFDLCIPSHVVVNVDAGAVDCNAFNLNMNYPLDAPGKLGSTAMAKKPIREDSMEVTGSFVALFDAMAQYDKFAAHTTVDVQAVCDSGGEEVCTVNMNKCKLRAGTPHLDGKSRLVATFDFESFFDTTATEALQAVVVNNQATVP